MSKDIDFLKSIRLFTDLSEDELAKFITICFKLSKKQGDIIMKEGEIGDSMYLFQEGTVEVSHALTMKIGKKGFEKTKKSMARLSAGVFSFFGDMSILSDAPRSATIKALTDCTLYSINKEDFDQFCQKNPVIGYKILRKISEVLCDRVRKGNSDVLKLTAALSIALNK